LTAITDAIPKVGSYASLLIQAIEQIRSKKPFGLQSPLARLQLERFFPPSANLRKNPKVV
jgi:hypothetical protein